MFVRERIEQVVGGFFFAAGFALFQSALSLVAAIIIAIYR